MSHEWNADRDLEVWVIGTLHQIHEAAANGLDDEQATSRARELEEAILSNRVSPSDFRASDEDKDVLYSLVYRIVRSRRPGREGERRASAVREFIAGVTWKGDSREKQKLIADCFSNADASHDSPPVEAFAEERRNVEPMQAESRQIFDRAMPLIKMLWLDEFRLTSPAARQLECDLFIWFERLVKRPDAGPKDARSLLFAAALQFARLLGNSDSTADADAKLEMLLRRALSEAARLRSDKGGDDATKTWASRRSSVEGKRPGEH